MLQTFCIMTTHRELSDEDFLTRFRTGELPPTLFTHEAHLRLAWLQLERYELAGAIEQVTQQIQSYVAKWGAQDKYHHTLTVAAVQMVDHFRQRAQTNDFTELLITFPRLRDDFQGLLENHYSKGHYQKAAARTEYLAPDLLPF